MIALLLLMGKLWKDFFLTRGQLDAPIKSVNAENKPGKRPISWGGVLGLILGICIAPLTLLFFGLGNLPTSTILIKALPYFPPSRKKCSSGLPCWVIRKKLSDLLGPFGSLLPSSDSHIILAVHLLEYPGV
jgi:hypothetical protein